MKTNKPYALNEQGQRQNQEDSIFPAKDRATEATRTFIVCDGMGGHSHGEVASATVCETLGAALGDASAIDKAVFDRALDAAYDALDAKDASEHGSRMGTTLTFLHIGDREAFLAHIGDSRIYHLRVEEGEARIVYRTSDHSLVNELLGAGVITPEEARVHPKKNVITRAMQPHEERRPRADTHRTVDVQAGDWFFMCSDGVTESLDDETLLAIIAAPTDAADKIEAIRKVCAGHSRDNFSAWLVPVAEGITASEPIDDHKAPEPAAVTDPPVPFAAKPAAPSAQKNKPKPHTSKSGLGWLWLILLVAVTVATLWFFV